MKGPTNEWSASPLGVESGVGHPAH